MKRNIEEYLNAQKKIHKQLINSDVNWAITGSFSLFLRGIQIVPNDIDIITDKNGAYKIEKQFQNFVYQNIHFKEIENIRSYFGVLLIDDIKIEIMGDIENKFVSKNDWKPRSDWYLHKEFVIFDKTTFPVLSLEYECDVYLKIGRIQQASIIIDYLKKKSLVTK